MTNLETHPTYKGFVQDFEINAPWGMPYWCDNTYEFLFEVAILLENTPKPGSNLDPSLAIAYKQQVLMNNYFCIVWVEDELDWDREILSKGGSHQFHYYIIISPLHNGLYHVRIKIEENSKFFFLEACCYCKTILGDICQKNNHEVSSYP
jgi:hypothetical protein